VLELKAIVFLSHREVFSGNTISLFFSTGKDSHVKLASSILSEAVEISLKSAGTISQASSIMISPITRFSDLIFFISPSLITFASGLFIFFNASNASSALLSCESQIIAFMITISKIKPHSKSSV
jgi:hypothetical protein